MTAAGTESTSKPGDADGDSGESPAAVLAPPAPEPEADDDDVRWLTRLREACWPW